MTVTSKRHKQKYRDRELNIVIDAIIDAIKCKETSFFFFFSNCCGVDQPHMGGACSEPECSGAESGPCGFGTDEVVEYGVGIAFARDSTVDTEPVDKFTSWSSDLKLLC